MRTMLVAVFACTQFAVLAAPTVTDEFLAAIRNDDLARVRELIQQKSRVLSAENNGISPLHYVSVFGSLEAMKALLAAGADPNAADALGAVPLHWSACSAERVKVLLDHGAAVNPPNSQGRTPLMAAASCDSATESIRMLLRAGADIHAREKSGSTALFDALKYGGPRIARLLLEAGAKADVQDEWGYTPLIEAVGWNDVELVRLLLKKGAAINARNAFGGKVRHGDIAMKNLTPLMFAAPYGSPEMIKTLLHAGADVKLRDARGMTPLMFSVASDNQDVRVVSLLLNHGSDVNAVDVYGDSVLDWARKFKQPAVISLLQERGARGRDVPDVARRHSPAFADPRDAAAKSVALLQRSSSEFFKQSGCIGCHHQPVMALAVDAARRAGITVHDKDFAEQRKTMVLRTAARPTRLLLGGFLDTLVNSILGLAADGYEPDLLTDSASAVIASRQYADGGWYEGGTVSRAPMQESTITRTVASIRVLTLYPIPSRKAEFEERIKRTRTWLVRAKPRTEYERAELLLGLHWTRASASQISRAAKALLKAQRADGGWAQRSHLESDAYMTGLALRALYESGELQSSDTAYQRGVQYLLRTQMEDGSWYVRSRAVKLQPYFQSGFPYGHDQWISSTATAYAATALARAAQHPANRRSGDISRSASSTAR